jgi:uncharacterized membrane protein HdeD (DUF308 family)
VFTLLCPFDLFYNKNKSMRPGISLALNLFKHTMAVIYIIAGVFLLFAKIEFLTIDKKYQYVVGVMLIVYGIYRIYRAIQSIRSDDEK